MRAFVRTGQVGGRSFRPAIDLWLVFAAALAFYSVTLAPTVVWGDSAGLSAQAFLGRYDWGTAGDHPLFVLVGHMFSALPGEVARNVNFEAAVFGALTVMLVYRCGRVLGTSRLAALIGAAALCVSHAFWLHSVIAEVYSANAFFLVAMLNLLLEWRRGGHGVWLAAASIVFAIGLTNHLVLALAAPPALGFVVATKGRALVTRRSLIGLAVLAGSLVVFALAWPGPAAAAFRKLWYGPPGISEYLELRFEAGPIAREAGFYLAYLMYQFPFVSWLLGAIGGVVLLRDRRDAALLLLSTLGFNAAFFIWHTVWASGSAGGSKYVFYIADYAVFSILCAVGADEVFRWIATKEAVARRRLLGGAMLAAVALVPPLFYAVMPSLAKRTGIVLIRASLFPYRDNDRFFLNPNKHGEDGARRFGQQALETVAPGAVVFADNTPYEVLRYLQVVDKLRPDIQLRSGAIGQAVKVQWILADGRRRPTYMATQNPGYYDLSGLTGEYDVIPTKLIFEVRARDVR